MWFKSILISILLVSAFSAQAYLLVDGNEFYYSYIQRSLIPGGTDLPPLTIPNRASKWTMAEFWSGAGLSGKYSTQIDCSYLFSNSYKAACLGKTYTSSKYDLALAVNTSNEYAKTFKLFTPNPQTGKFDSTHKKWVHFTIGRSLTEISKSPVSSFSSIRLNMSARLIKADILNPSTCSDCQGENNYKASYHKLHFTHQLVLRNPTNGQGLTIVLPIYSSSEAYPAEMKMVDYVMGILIYRLSQKDFIKTKDNNGQAINPQSGLEFSMSVDLLAQIKKAISYGCSAAVLSSCRLEDYIFTQAGLGWEAPGLGFANVGLKNYSLEFK